MKENPVLNEFVAETTDVTEQSQADFDPRMASVIRVEDLKEVGTVPKKPHIKIWKDSIGRRLYGPIQNYPVDQMLVSKMLKGISPVCDVVAVVNENSDPEFYSYELPLDKVPVDKPIKDNLHEIDADLHFLSYIFNDDDRNDSYLNIGFKNGHHSLYDFHEAYHFWQYDLLRDAIDYQIEIPQQERESLIKKSKLLQERLQGEEGLKFLNSIIGSAFQNQVPASKLLKNKGENKPTEDDILSLRDEVVARARRLETWLGSHRESK